MHEYNLLLCVTLAAVLLHSFALVDLGFAQQTVHHEERGYARYYVNGANEPPFEFLHDPTNDPDQRSILALTMKDSDEMKEIRAHCDKLIAEADPAMKVRISELRERRNSEPLRRENERIGWHEDAKEQRIRQFHYLGSLCAFRASTLLERSLAATSDAH